MTKRRTILAAIATLTSLGIGLVATGASAGAALTKLTSTTMPGTLATNCSTNCRTKNAALPATTTTAQPRTITTPVPTIKPRTKNAALPTTTQPRTVTTPVPILAKPSGSKISTH